MSLFNNEPEKKEKFKKDKSSILKYLNDYTKNNSKRDIFRAERVIMIALQYIIKNMK